MRKICAIYDQDEQYAYRFMNYVNDRRLLPYEVILFTQKGVLQEYLKESRIELLLKAANSETLDEGMNVGRIIELLEDVDGGEGVYKYQSIDQLAREVLQILGNSQEELTVLPKGNCRVYGVYSPVARSGKTTFAISVAMCVARNARTLYVNLEEYCGITEFINDTGGNLSELLYYYRNSKEKLKIKLGQAIKNYGGFEYIPVCSNPEDYEEIMPEEWIAFLGNLENNGGYEAIVLDLGNAVHEAWKLLSLCDKVYMPKVTDVMGRKKEERFLEYMHQIGREKLLQKIERVDVPYDEELKQMEDISKLQWSKIGEYTRGLIYG